MNPPALPATPNGNAQQLATVPPVASPPMIAYTIATAPDVPERDIISVEEIIGIVRRYWRPAAILAASIALLAFLHLQIRPKSYQASTLILMEPHTRKSLNLTSVHQSGMFEYTFEEKLRSYQVELLSSKFRTHLYDQLPEDLRTAFMVSAGKPFLVGLFPRISVSSGATKGAPDPLAAFLDRTQKKISSTVLKDTHILKMTVSHHDPEVAARFANATAEAFTDYITRKESDRVEQINEFLSGQLDELMKDVQAREQELVKFRHEEKLLPTQRDSIGISNPAIAELSKRNTETQILITTNRAILERIEALEGNDEGLLNVKEIAAFPGLDKLQEQLAMKEREAEVAALEYGPLNPKLQRLQREVDLMRHQRSEAIQTATRSVRSNLQTELDRLQSIETEFTRLAANDDKQLQHQLMEQRLKAERDLFDRLTLQMNETRVAAQFSGAGVLRVADVAMPPEDPSGPRLMVSGLVSAVLFGFILLSVPVGLHLFEQIKQMIRRTPRTVPCPVPPPLIPLPLNPVPDAETSPETQVFYPGTVSSGPPVIAALPQIQAGNSHDLLRDLATMGTPHSRILGGIVRECAQSTRCPRIFVTSSLIQEGKSTVSVAMALAASSGLARILLIEANAGSPSLHSWFPRTPSSGARGAEILPDEYLPLLRRGNGGLHVLTKSDWQDRPQASAELLRRADQMVDAIIFDASAMENGAAHYCSLESMISHAVIIRDPANRVARQECYSTLRQILPRANLMGEILNRCN